MVLRNTHTIDRIYWSFTWLNTRKDVLTIKPSTQPTVHVVYQILEDDDILVADTDHFKKNILNVVEGDASHVDTVLIQSGFDKTLHTAGSRNAPIYKMSINDAKQAVRVSYQRADLHPVKRSLFGKKKF